MSKVEFTTEQKKVIDAPVCDLLVSAAAGSGKTAVLVERIIKKICDEKNPVDIDKILIVTFTRNAASSMKNRLYLTLEEMYEKDPGNRNLLSQIQKLNYADITTIDSFCMKIVKSYFFASDIDPNFRIADNSETDLILYDSIKEVMEQEYENSSPGFLKLMSAYGGTKDDSEIMELIRKLIKISGSYPWQRDSINELGKIYGATSNEEFNTSDLAREICANTSYVINDCIGVLNSARLISLEDSTLIKYTECLDDDISLLRAVNNSSDYSEYEKRLNSLKFRRAPVVRNADERLAGSIKEFRDSVKNIIKTHTEEYYSLPDYIIVEDNKTLKPYVDAIIDITLKVLDRYEEVKHRKNIMEFSDVAHTALDILMTKDGNGERVPTVYAEELRRQYNEIMIDEYQDSNMLQETILRAVSGEKTGSPNIFMVGDVKQSIYKFRMAKPQLFMQKYHTYGKGEQKNLVIDLQKNFRSASCVIKTVNSIFENIMTENICNISYDDKAALKQGSEIYKDYEATEDAVNEYHLIEVGAVESDARYDTISDMISNRIQGLINSEFPVVCREGVRPVKYSDIVILVRSMSGIANVLAEKLPEAGIPTCINTTTGYFKTTEIRLVLNYLRILDNPCQDIAMAAVLHSYCGGLTDEELAEIRIYDRELNNKASYLYEAALQYMKSDEPDKECRNKLSEFFRVYDLLKKCAAYMSTVEILGKIYEMTGYYNYVGILPAGNIRKANLDMLYVKAGEYEKTDLSGISGFLRYVDKMIKYEIDMGESGTYDGLDAVRVMTIHSSKGLEYPVVILAETEKGFNFNDEKSNFVLDPDVGLGLKVINEEDNSYHSSIQKSYIGKRIHRESIAEEIRILYVALTRAKQKLIIYGAVKEMDKALTKWEREAEISGDTLSYSYLCKSSSYMNMMLPALLKENNSDSGIRLIPHLMQSLSNKKEQDNIIIPEGKKDVWEERNLYREIGEYLDYTYPFSSENIPVKFSVSQLKHEAMEEYESFGNNNRLVYEFDAETESKLEPAFITGEVSGKVNVGAKKGTLTHLLMQKAVTENFESYDKLCEYVNLKIATGEFNEEIRMVNLRKVFGFLESDLCRRMKKASEKGDLYVEQPFVIGIPACELGKGYVSTEKVMIQGIIDAFFIEDEQVILLDYKTDRVPAEGGEEILKQRYSKQMELYAQAIEKIKKISIKSKIIYSFSLEKVIYL